MAGTKGKTVVSSEIPDEVKEALDARAALEGRSRGKAIEIAIRFWLEYAEEQEAEPLPKVKVKKGGKE